MGEGSGGAEASVLTGNLRDTALESHYWPYFAGHGFVSTHSQIVRPSRFDPNVDESEFYHHGKARHAGRDCVIVRTENDHFTGKAFNEYWVDMARDGAILRQILYVDTLPVKSIDITYKEAGGGWLPTSWTVSWQGGAKRQTTRIYKVRVDVCEPGVSLSGDEFRPALAPGMKVRRLHMGGDEDSLEPASPVSDQLFVVSAGGSLVQTGGTRSTSGAFSWLVGVGTAGALALGAWVVFRRKRV